MRNLKAYDKAIADFAYRVKEELMQELPTNYATTRPYFGLKEQVKLLSRDFLPCFKRQSRDIRRKNGYSNDGS